VVPLFFSAALSTIFIFPLDARQSPVVPHFAETGKPAKSQEGKGAEWSKYGTLEATDLRDENAQPIYALKEWDKLVTYVGTPKGKSLVRYMGAVVSVFGPTIDLPNGKIRIVLASHIAVGIDVVKVYTRSFAVPIDLDVEKTEQVEIVRMYVSEDRGKKWKFLKECKPTDKQGEFQATSDDLYMFAFQLVKKDGTSVPAKESELKASRVFLVSRKDKIREIEDSDSDLRQEVQDLRRLVDRLQKRIRELERDRMPK
jgi:hypothetical protein